MKQTMKYTVLAVLLLLVVGMIWLATAPYRFELALRQWEVERQQLIEPITGGGQ